MTDVNPVLDRAHSTCAAALSACIAKMSPPARKALLSRIARDEAHLEVRVIFTVPAELEMWRVDADGEVARLDSASWKPTHGNVRWEDAIDRAMRNTTFAPQPRHTTLKTLAELGFTRQTLRRLLAGVGSAEADPACG